MFSSIQNFKGLFELHERETEMYKTKRLTKVIEHQGFGHFTSNHVDKSWWIKIGLVNEIFKTSLPYRLQGLVFGTCVLLIVTATQWSLQSLQKETPSVDNSLVLFQY